MLFFSDYIRIIAMLVNKACSYCIYRVVPIYILFNISIPLFLGYNEYLYDILKRKAFFLNKKKNI